MLISVYVDLCSLNPYLKLTHTGHLTPPYLHTVLVLDILSTYILEVVLQIKFKLPQISYKLQIIF